MEWRDVPGYPGYQTSERGGLRTDTGYALTRKGRRYSLYRAGQIVRLMPEELMALAWLAIEDLPDPATSAPEQTPAEPAPTKERKVPARPRDKIRQLGNRAQRRCHDCGKPTNNYRCDVCWARLRGYGQEGAAKRASGTLWDEF